MGGTRLNDSGEGYTVIFSVVTDREPDRMIYVDMSPESARNMAAALLEAADRTERYNAKRT
jgi:(2Fe-2S) ferredoxin